MTETKHKLVLGTVQFGLPYGVTNTQGKVSFKEVVSILELAAKNGINVLDSASSYGDSEEVIGKAILELGKATEFTAVTKVFLKNSKDIKTQVFSQIEKTLKDLKGVKLHSLMIHQGQQILEFKEELVSVILDAKEQFSIPKIGSSVYELGELQKVSELIKLEIIQLPYNVLNQNFFNDEFISPLKKKGCEIHARSLFLQGVLLAPQNEIHSYFKNFPGEISAYYAALKKSELSPLDFNLSNAFSNKLIDSLVVGVLSRKELQEIIVSSKNFSSLPLTDLKYLNSTNEELINPAKWKLS